jgi:hypothetical protein
VIIDALLNVLLRLLRVPWALYRSGRARALAGLVCVGALTIAVNVLATDELPQRFDATQDRRYTLSATTAATLARIAEPITLRFYYSPRLGAAIPADGRYAGRVRALLTQYTAAARGKLRLETLDPEPRSAAEAAAVAAGLRAVPIDGQADFGFFGLVGTNSTDDRASVALFNPAGERLLQDDLTRLIHALALPDAAAADTDLAGSRRGDTAAPPPTLIERWRQQGDAPAAQWLAAIVEFSDVALAPILVAVAALAIWRRQRPAAAG